MIAKKPSEKNCSADVVKFLDRIDMYLDGSAEGVLEFIISVGTEIDEALSELNIILPNRLKGNTVRDVTNTLKDRDLHFNKSYSNPVKPIGKAEDGLFEVDGIPCCITKNGINIAAPMDNHDRLCIFSIDFEPIQPGDKRIFRIYYEIPSFGKVYSSMGFFQYIFNNAFYSTEHQSKVEAFIPLALGIDRSLCEIAVYLPEGYLFTYANPDPQLISYTRRCKLLSNEYINGMKSILYYDLEGYKALPGRKIGEILLPHSDQDIVFYCQFCKPAVASEDFMAKTEEINQMIDETAKKISKAAKEAEDNINNLSNVSEVRVRRIIRNSWIAFAITVVISLIAIFLGLFQIYSIYKGGTQNETKKMETPLIKPNMEKAKR